MNNAVQHYGQAAIGSSSQMPFLHTDVSANPVSTTSTLRQFRKKDNLEKLSAQQDGVSNVNATESGTHVARVAPHNHFPPRTNEYYRPNNNPLLQEYGMLYKEHQQVKYSEISEQQPNHHDHLSSMMQKPKKDYLEMMPQNHIKQGYPDHHLNGQQNYSSDMHPGQYLHKDPQLHAYKNPESQQYFHKEQYSMQQMSKYNMPAQMRKYQSQENDFFSQLQKVHPTMARSIMSEHHMRESQMSYPPSSMEQNRIYNQNHQRYYPNSIQNPNYHSNSYGIPQHYSYPPSQNCNFNNRTNQMPRFSPASIERSISPATRRNVYANPDMMNYVPLPQKISPSYHHQYPEYAQHYQHRRNNIAPHPSQEYFPQQCRNNQFLQNTNVPSEVPESRVTPSNDIKQFIENWADDEVPGDVNKDQTLYIVNSDEVQYLELENGQYILKNSVIEGTSGESGEPSKVTDCMLDQAGSKVVIHSNTIVIPSKSNQARTEDSTKVDKNCSPINLEHLEDSDCSKEVAIQKTETGDSSEIINETKDESPKSAKLEVKDMPMIDFGEDKSLKTDELSNNNDDNDEEKKIPLETIEPEIQENTLNCNNEGASENTSDGNNNKAQELSEISENTKDDIVKSTDIKEPVNNCSEIAGETVVNEQSKSPSKCTPEIKLPEKRIKSISRRKKRFFSVDDIINNIGNKKEKEAKRRKSINATQKFLDLERNLISKEIEETTSSIKIDTSHKELVDDIKVDSESKQETNSDEVLEVLAQDKEVTSTETLVPNDDVNSNVQYRSAIKIEENSVLLHIAGELVEINVNIQNGKKVITVVPISDTTVVDFNDNYETLETNQLEEGPKEFDDNDNEHAPMNIEEIPVTETNLSVLEGDLSEPIEVTIEDNIVEDIAKEENVIAEELIETDNIVIEPVNNNKDSPKKDVEIEYISKITLNENIDQVRNEIITVPNIEETNKSESSFSVSVPSPKNLENQNVDPQDESNPVVPLPVENQNIPVPEKSEKLIFDEKPVDVPLDLQTSKNSDESSKINHQEIYPDDMSNEIIIGDESLELEVELDLQNDGKLEDNYEKNVVLCTKAAMKAYDSDFLQSAEHKKLNKPIDLQIKKTIKTGDINCKTTEDSSTKKIKRATGKSEVTKVKKSFEEFMRIRNLKKQKQEQKREDDEEYVSFKELVKARKLKKMRKLQEGNKTNEENTQKAELSENSLDSLKKFRLPKKQTITLETPKCEGSQNSIDNSKDANKVESKVIEPILKKDDSPIKPPKSVSFSVDKLVEKIEHDGEKYKECTNITEINNSFIHSHSLEDAVKKKKLSLEDYNNRKRKSSPIKQENNEEVTQKEELYQRSNSVEDLSKTKDSVPLKRTASVEETITKFNFNNDWEETMSPKVETCDDNKPNDFKGLIDLKPSPKDVTKISEENQPEEGEIFDDSPKNEEKKDELQIFKEQVCSKLSSLCLNIPKKSTAQTLRNQICALEKKINNFSLTPKDIGENHILMTRFLNKDYLSEDEMKKIKQIIQYKRMVQHLKKLKTLEEEGTAYEVRKEMEEREELKLHLKKMPDDYQKKRKRRFRNLYAKNSSEESDSDFESGDKEKTLCDYSVVAQSCQFTGVPKLIIKRKVDMPQPIVRLERLDMNLYKKRKWY